jgi:3-oxoisoapionate kinase
MTGPPGLLLTFYGDDFTGSTDAMEALTLAGLRTVLFFSPPAPELLESRLSDVSTYGTD